MKWSGLPSVLAVLLLMRAPSGHTAVPGTAPEVREAIRLAGDWEHAGGFRQAAAVLDRALGTADLAEDARRALTWERERLERIRRDYPLTTEALKSAVRAAVRDLGDAELDQWLGDGRFDSRMIDGERRYFVSSVSNLFFRHPELESRRSRPRETAGVQRAYLENARSIRRAAELSGRPYVLPKRFRVRMQLEVKPGVVPPGVLVSAWLPIPRVYPHQSGASNVTGDPVPLQIAAPEAPARSVYQQRAAADDGGAGFRIGYEFAAHGVWHDPDRPGTAGPGGSLERWLGEAPHVVFTPEVRRLSAEVAAGAGSPRERAWRYYAWISTRIRYSYAPEYSTVRNLGELCLATGRGDCGQATFLFMTLCRIAGIPARWQSGWAIFPGDETIHDWCEIHLDGAGWIPVDPYMGMYAMQYATSLGPGEREELRRFYFGGLTQYRIAANSDHSQPLDPPKRAIRSDDVDFQRGEVEAGGRNLFFGEYRYALDWEEVK